MSYTDTESSALTAWLPRLSWTCICTTNVLSSSYLLNLFSNQGEIHGLEESKKLLEEENQKLLERICALEEKQVQMQSGSVSQRHTKTWSFKEVSMLNRMLSRERSSFECTEALWKILTNVSFLEHWFTWRTLPRVKFWLPRSGQFCILIGDKLVAIFDLCN